MKKGYKMPIINTKDLPEVKMVRLVDLTEDSINHITEAVVSKLNKSVKHGRWVHKYGDGHIEIATLGGECSECGFVNTATPYCPNCGAKMDSPCSNCQEFDCYGCEVKMDEVRDETN